MKRGLLLLGLVALCSACATPASYPGAYGTPGGWGAFKRAVQEDILTKTAGYNLTVADMQTRTTLLMTTVGEVGFPDCSADTIGLGIRVMARDAEKVELVMNGDTTNDLFVLLDGTNLDANDEADMAAAKSAQACVKCLEANKWYIVNQVGAVTDGGAAD